MKLFSQDGDQLAAGKFGLAIADLRIAMTTPDHDNEKFPLEGERGDALIALLGPKALRELRTLIRLAALPDQTSSPAQTDATDDLDQAA